MGFLVLNLYCSISFLSSSSAVRFLLPATIKPCAGGRRWHQSLPVKGGGVERATCVSYSADWKGPGPKTSTASLCSRLAGAHTAAFVPLLPVPLGWVALASNTCTFIHTPGESCNTRGHRPRRQLTFLNLDHSELLS